MCSSRLLHSNAVIAVAGNIKRSETQFINALRQKISNNKIQKFNFHLIENALQLHYN
jgi:hypothetical protein